MSHAPSTIVVAPDSFKESLPAPAVAAAIISGLRHVWPATEYLSIPMADGGEGTTAAIIAATGGRLHTAIVTGPLGEPVAASFGITPDGIAIVEMAAGSGLALVPPANRDPLLATSYGTGELLLAALDAGAGRCVIGIGGSATVDGGAGILQALGASLLDPGGQPIPRGGASLGRLAHIDLTTLDPRLRACSIEVACDVDNPLLGPTGAATVFGPQKGATPQMVSVLEQALAHLAKVIRSDLGLSVEQVPRGGAAGGAGAALLACLGASLLPGAALIAGLVGLEPAVARADLVFTGEGRIDSQTVHGKTPIGVAEIARRHAKPVIALAGATGPGWEGVLAHGIDAVFSITQRPCTREDAFAETAENLRTTARNIASLLQASSASSETMKQ